MDTRFECCILLIILVSMPLCHATKELTLLPNDPNFIVGRNITMTCCRSSATSFTVEDIRFELELRGSSRSVEKRIPRTFVHILDDKCVRLDLSPVRKEHDAATIFCLCDSCHLQADSQRIRVGYKPDRPVILNYTVSNWNNFVFEWKTNRTDHMYKTDYIAWYKTRNKNFTRCDRCPGNIPTVSCPRQTSSSCVIPTALDLVHPDGMMEIKVNASNLVGNSSSEVIHLDLFHHVKPYPVSNAGVTTNGSLTPVLTFSSPLRLKGWRGYDNLVYKVTTSCSSGHRETKTFKTRQSTITQLLDGLPPYSVCTTSVACKADYANPQYGYWSDSVSTEFRSQEGVPLSAPETCSSCFSIHTNFEKSRAVVLYFKSLDVNQARGVVRHYRLCLMNDSATETETESDSIIGCSTNDTFHTNRMLYAADASYLRLSLSPVLHYIVAVDAATAAGFNQSLHHLNGINIPEKASVLVGPANFTAIQQADSSVKLSWTKVEGAVQYVIAWCKDRKPDLTCNDLQWQKVGGEHTAHRVTGPFSSDFSFGLAVEIGPLSSGIKWSDCLYDVRAVAEPPAIPLYEPTDTSVTFTIEKQDCSHSKAYIHGFVIYFSEKVPGARSQMKIVDQQELRNDKYTVQDLKPETKYLFTFQSLSVGSAGGKNSTKFLEVTTDKGKLSKVVMGVISVCGFIGFVLIVIGLYATYRWNKKKCAAFWGVAINVPASYDHFSKENEYHKYVSSPPDTKDTLHNSDSGCLSGALTGSRRSVASVPEHPLLSAFCSSSPPEETVPLVSDDGHNPTRRLSEIEKAVNGTLDEDADTYSPEYMKCGVVPEPQFEPTSAPHTPQLCHVERSENLSDEVDDEENASTALMVESNEESNVDAEAGADEVNSYVLAAVDDASDTLSDDSDAVSMSSSEVETHVEAHVNDVSASPVTTEPEDVTQSFTDLSVYAHANLFDEEPYALAGLNTNSGSIPLQDTDSFSTSNGSYCPVAFSVV